MRTKLASAVGAVVVEEPESAPGSDDPMAALAYEDTRGHGDSASPDSGKKARRRRRTVGATVEAPVKVSMAAKAPEMHPDEKASVEVLLLNSALQLWVHVDSLAWLLEFLRDQTRTAGVPAVAARAGATRPPSAPAPGISWDFRDDAWVASGTERDRKAIYVRKRTRTKGDPLFGMEWEAAKAHAYEELVAWRAAAETSAVAESGRDDCSRSSSSAFGVIGA
ncbi:MAG: hypothetical protein GY772_21365 [bacterium]|nr:hypothetical protein [bacterium]